MSADDEFINACTRGDMDAARRLLAADPVRMASIQHPRYDDYPENIQTLLDVVCSAKNYPAHYGLIPMFGNAEVVDALAATLSAMEKSFMYETMGLHNNLEALREHVRRHRFDQNTVERWIFLASGNSEKTLETLAFLLSLQERPIPWAVANMCGGVFYSIPHMEMVIMRNLELGATTEELGRWIDYTRVNCMPVHVFTFLRERLGAFPDDAQVLAHAPKSCNRALWDLLSPDAGAGSAPTASIAAPGEMPLDL